MIVSMRQETKVRLFGQGGSDFDLVATWAQLFREETTSYLNRPAQKKHPYQDYAAPYRDYAAVFRTNVE